MRARSWRWLRTRIVGLLSRDTRLSRDLRTYVPLDIQIQAEAQQQSGG